MTQVLHYAVLFQENKNIIYMFSSITKLYRSYSQSMLRIPVFVCNIIRSAKIRSNERAKIKLLLFMKESCMEKFASGNPNWKLHYDAHGNPSVKFSKPEHVILYLMNHYEKHFRFYVIRSKSANKLLRVRKLMLTALLMLPLRPIKFFSVLKCFLVRILFDRLPLLPILLLPHFLASSSFLFFLFVLIPYISPPSSISPPLPLSHTLVLNLLFFLFPRLPLLLLFFFRLLIFFLFFSQVENATFKC